MASCKMSPLLQLLYQLASIANNSVDLLTNLDLSILSPLCFSSAFTLVNANQKDAVDFCSTRSGLFQNSSEYVDEECINELSDTSDNGTDADDDEGSVLSDPSTYTFHRELKLLNKRLRRTLYCNALPDSVLDSPACSWALTEHVLDVVDRLTQSCGDKEAGFPVENDDDDFIPTFLVTQEFHPCAVIQALIYCDRYRDRCRQGKTIYSPPVHIIRHGSDAFLAALMIASKMLHDSGEEGDVYNKLWADESNRSNAALNKLEMEFASALDWDLNISDQEFWAQLLRVEALLVWKRQQSAKNGPNFTYSEMVTLYDWLGACNTGGAIRAMIEQAVRVILVCTSAYVASIMVATALNSAVMSVVAPKAASGVDSTPAALNLTTIEFSHATDYVDDIASMPTSYSNFCSSSFTLLSEEENAAVQQQRQVLAAAVKQLRLAVLRQQLLLEPRQYINVNGFESGRFNYDKFLLLGNNNSFVYDELSKPQWVTTTPVGGGGQWSYYYDDNLMPFNTRNANRSAVF